jgi:hypothetical protein
LIYDSKLLVGRNAVSNTMVISNTVLDENGPNVRHQHGIGNVQNG